MWVLTLFDLPVDSKKARRAYADFRKFLLRDGFQMLQFSVYARHCASDENAQVHIVRVERNVPEEGEVRIVVLTDKQFERMRVFWGKTRKAAEVPAEQMELF